MLRVSEEGHRRREGFVANYQQLHQSLLDLQIAADRIFDTISKRTAEQREKLTGLSARIDNAKAMIDTLSNSKKAITVTSCSRYPRAINEGDLPSLFSYKDEATGAGFPVGKLSLDGGLSKEFGVDGTLELFQFFSETSAEFYPNEQQLKEVGDTTRLKGKTSIIHDLEPPKYINEAYSSSSDYQNLPPPPPSLLMRNKQLLSKSEDFRRSGESSLSGAVNTSLKK
ncbi:uncharacterized protein [Aristolochia californica]|uniref:uncharacterized protein isoform X2 n=1 Tax=Aristolochia californica TaxID=171875 RepID=UPI0035E26490